jgi:hypothetical protein
MSSGGSRAATATTARHVKQALVKLLFGKKYARTGPEGHRQLDYSIYTYDTLRKAYLDRLQVIHPDKAKSVIGIQREGHYNATTTNSNNHSNDNTAVSVEQMKVEFQQLQSAWDKYEEMAKSMRVVMDGDGEDANFTLFGVGCSFSDNDQERALRTEITDQACRGWFTSGLLPDEKGFNTIVDSSSHRSIQPRTTPLTDESMFVEIGSNVDNGSSTKINFQSDQGCCNDDDNRNHPSYRTLIPGFKHRT